MTLDSSFSLSSSSSPDLSVARRDIPPGRGPFSASHNRKSFCFGPENVLARTFLPEHFPSFKGCLFPLFLYGPSGCGKSELASFIASEFFPNSSVHSFCISDFFRSFVDSIDLDDVAGFRHTLISGDSVILIDNFEQVITRPLLFNELVFLFDYCPKIIVTSSLHPSDLPKLPYRVTSRLLSGFSIPFKNPSSSTKQLILKHEISKLNAFITDEASLWLVDRFCLSLPDIKHVVSKLKICLDFSKPIDLCSVLKVFKLSSFPIVSLADISCLVSKRQKLKARDLKSQSRKRSVVLARGIAIYIARKIFKYKYQDIGYFFGNRDHTTILHAYKKIVSTISVDPELRRSIDDVLSVLKQKNIP